MSTTQKALFLDSGSFTVRETGIPNLRAGQLLVRVEAASLSPADWKVQKWNLLADKYPLIVGLEAAGVVEELGEGVSTFEKGDRVLFQCDWSNDYAGFQQYALSNAVTTAKIPDHISFDEAASIPAASAAALIGLYFPEPQGAGLTAPLDSTTQGKESGRPILVIGGGTSVGQFVIQFAKLSGFSHILTTASLKHESFLKSLGATHVLDRHLSTEALAAAVRNITSEPIKYVYDGASLPETQATGYSILAEGGNLGVVNPPSVEVIQGKAVYRIFGQFTQPHTEDLGAKYYSHLFELLQRGDIKPNRIEVVHGGLRAVADGLKRLELDQVSGVKLIVHPQETA